MARQFTATYYYSTHHSNFNVPTKAEYELNKLLLNKDRKFTDVIMTVPANDVVMGNISKCWMKINSGSYKKGRIACSISGGSDSDVLLDITRRCDPDRKIFYYFIDTGLEAKATKDHLDYLQLKYQIKIHRFKAKTPIPLAVKREGIPFVSKQVSEFLQRLQNYGFEFDDTDDLEALCEKYCKKLDPTMENVEAIAKAKRYSHVGNGYYKGCVAALQWWCNKWGEDGKISKFDIRYNKYLKEFLVENKGVPFKVANRCCKLSKKDTIKDVLNEICPRLSIQGVRKAEGGARSSAYKSCFNDASEHPWDEYRPLFWFTNADKKDYEEFCGINHSKLYDYLKRTGCSGCPFGRDIDTELECFKEIEPNMYKAMNFVFAPSYEFTKKYREFQTAMKAKEKLKKSEFT